MNKAMRRCSAFAVALMMCLTVLSCGPKLTPERFEKVQTGMTTEQVKGLIGEPGRVDTASLPIVGTVTTYTYQTGSSEVTLVFRDDRLRLKRGSLRP